MLRTLAFAAALALMPAAVFAGEATQGDIMITNAWARATPKGAAVGAGYLTVQNHGAAADTLTGGTADFADVQIHEMKMVGNVMKMRELKDGLAIPANGEVKLAPSGYHVMFVNLRLPLVKGEKAHVTLTFARAGAVAVDFEVQGVGASAPASQGMGNMKM